MVVLRETPELKAHLFLFVFTLWLCLYLCSSQLCRRFDLWNPNLELIVWICHSLLKCSGNIWFTLSNTNSQSSVSASAPSSKRTSGPPTSSESRSASQGSISASVCSSTSWKRDVLPSCLLSRRHRRNLQTQTKIRFHQDVHHHRDWSWFCAIEGLSGGIRDWRQKICWRRVNWRSIN